MKTSPPHAISTQSPQKRAVVYFRVSTSRQATKNNEAEGYSIPQQRELCSQKAQSLGAVVVDEFVDAGASARSANRPALQQMLALLESPSSDIDYVIVHKLDRLARDRADDVTIVMAIKAAGATLVSVRTHR
ncbi:recombinase family protein [Microbacterium sp. NPDC077184]|uniref:recombinase family protein n=1 Tax=Microbacterium sp. NPDC077184 TaxID=3154764 RepID=UPI00343DDB9A